jgi:hypothetical protein
MSLEHLNRIDGRRKPFTYLNRDSRKQEVDVRQEDDARRKLLKTLHLGVESTAKDIRRTAISLRSKFATKGLDKPTLTALKWVLEETRDTITSDEFLRFLGDQATFEEIEADRWDFR